MENFVKVVDSMFDALTASIENLAGLDLEPEKPEKPTASVLDERVTGNAMAVARPVKVYTPVKVKSRNPSQSAKPRIASTRGQKKK